MKKPSSSALWAERLKSPLTWHYVGFGTLVVLVVVLAVRLGLDWAATNSRSTDALAEKQMELKSKEMQTAPLRGLDKRVEEARSQMKAFYDKRIPPNYSSISNRVGELQVQSGVRMSRLQYTQNPPGADLTEISLDAGISGSYPQIMHFINSLERDETFFVIRTMALTGQQGGLVNLRLRVSTWLRPEDAEASGLPPTPSDTEAAPAGATTNGTTPGGNGPANAAPAPIPAKEGE
jgi:type IV pilus assembly protein PilO